jgi:hypothetical protein
VHLSTSSGNLYYFHPKTGKALWWSSRAPFGWGKSVDAGGSETFVGLFTGAVCHRIPAEPDRLPKRPRSPDLTASDEVKRVKPSPVVESSPTAVSESVPADTPLPRIREEWLRRGYPPTRPVDKVQAALSAALGLELEGGADTIRPKWSCPLFQEAHQLVLAQVLSAATVAARTRSARGDPVVTFLDLGAGLGRTSAFAVEKLQSFGAKPLVVSIDCWHAPYASALLRAHGDKASSASVRSLCESEGGSEKLRASDLFMDCFCENTWQLREHILPVRSLLPQELYGLRGQGIEPDVVFVDCEWDASRIRRVLRSVFELFPRAVVCGSGWKQSAGVRTVVTEVAKVTTRMQRASSAVTPGGGSASEPAEADEYPCPELAIELHVEQGLCWCLHGSLVRKTKNDPTASMDALHMLSSARVEKEAVVVHDSPKTWIGDVARLIDRGDAGKEVWELCRGRGRSVHDARRAVQNMLPGSLPGEDEGTTWIDVPQEGAKRGMTLLMLAAKLNRRSIVRALIARGARVNVQAPNSLYTALIIASFEGHGGVVRLLLRAGADTSLVNKFGETALVAAGKNRKAFVQEMIRMVDSLGTRRSEVDLDAVLPPVPEDSEEERAKDSHALLGVFHE